MGIFSKSKWVELNRKDWDKLIKGLKEFKTLQRIIGNFADGTLQALWNKYCAGGKGIYSNTDDGEKDYKKMMSRLLQHELNCVLTGHYYLGKLQLMAQTKVFTNTYGNQTLLPTDYGAKVTDANDVLATRWIINSSNSLVRSADDENAPVNAAKIKTALTTAATMDIRSEATLRYIHSQTVNQAGLRPTRCVSLEAPYPSTGGAGFLLDATFKFAQGIQLPPDKDPAWFDLACFLLGGVIRSHGFTDGNGRVGRGAYAAAMLAGNLPFVALKPAAEKLIHGLSAVA